MSEHVVKPSIRVTDHWPNGTMDINIRYAYRVMIESEAITVDKVTVDKDTRSVLVTYLANAPQEWIHQELRKYADQHREEVKP